MPFCCLELERILTSMSDEFEKYIEVPARKLIKNKHVLSSHCRPSEQKVSSVVYLSWLAMIPACASERSEGSWKGHSRIRPTQPNRSCRMVLNRGAKGLQRPEVIFCPNFWPLRTVRSLQFSLQHASMREVVNVEPKSISIEAFNQVSSDSRDKGGESASFDERLRQRSASAKMMPMNEYLPSQEVSALYKHSFISS